MNSHNTPPQMSDAEVDQALLTFLSQQGGDLNADVKQPDLMPRFEEALGQPPNGVWNALVRGVLKGEIHYGVSAGDDPHNIKTVLNKVGLAPKSDKLN